MRIRSMSYINIAHGKSTRLTADTDNPQQTTIKGRPFRPHLHLLTSFFLIKVYISRAQNKPSDAGPVGLPPPKSTRPWPRVLNQRGSLFCCCAAQFQVVSYRNPMRHIGAAATSIGVLTAASIGHGFYFSSNSMRLRIKP